MGLSAKQRLRAERYNSPERKGKKEKQDEQGYKVSAVVLGLFIFLVIGSALFQIIGSFSKGDAAMM